MRLVPVLVLAAMLAFAGCFGKSNNNDNGGDTGATTPTDATPSSPTGSTPAGTTPTSPGGTDTNSTTPATLAPKQACSANVDFTETPNGGAPTPPADTPCNIDAGYTKLVLNVTWAIAGGAPAAPDPNGVTVSIGGATCSLPGPVDQSPAACANKAGTAAPGKMAIKYGGGPAPITATVTVMELQ